MACKAYQTPFLRYIATRGYAAKAAPSAACGRSQEIEVSTLPNKMIVASADCDLPVSRISVVFRAGSRHETYDTLGASHILRASGGLTTNNSSGFAITRNLQQMGANLTITSDREIVAYTAESTCASADAVLKFLEDVATSPAFKPWELKDLSPTFRAHLAARSGIVRAVELLHKAAFRTGLGNSIYIPKYHIGSISPESLQHYFSTTCTTNRCAVVGVGIDHNMLSGFAQNLCLESGEGALKSRSEYRGGAEIRKDRSGDMAYVAVAGQGGCLSNMKEALAFAVLQQVCGARPSIKRGGYSGLFKKAAESVDGAQLAAFNASYADSGLFGFVVAANASDAGKVIDAATRALKSASSASSADFNRGKALLKGIASRSYTSGKGLLADIGTQAVLTGKISNTKDLIAAIDAVTDAEVVSAANKVLNSVFCMGASGNLRKVPYVTDLA